MYGNQYEASPRLYDNPQVIKDGEPLDSPGQDNVFVYEPSHNGKLNRLYFVVFVPSQAWDLKTVMEFLSKCRQQNENASSKCRQQNENSGVLIHKIVDSLNAACFKQT